MKQSEAKKLFIQYTNERFEKWNFKEKKNRRSEAIFMRNKQNGFEIIGVSTTNYYPEVVFGMGTQKRCDKIEEILLEIDQKYKLNMNLSKADTFTLSYQGKHKNERRLQLLEVENRDNERGVKESTKILMNFIENELLPAYDLFDDLRELDKIINGDGNNFWENDDWSDKPFNLGQYFGYRRLIIARLSKKEKDFNVFLEKIYSLRDKKAEKLGVPKIDKNDLSNKTNIVIKYLKENVSPIY